MHRYTFNIIFAKAMMTKTAFTVLFVMCLSLFLAIPLFARWSADASVSVSLSTHVPASFNLYDTIRGIILLGYVGLLVEKIVFPNKNSLDYECVLVILAFLFFLTNSSIGLVLSVPILLVQFGWEYFFL